MLLGLVTLDEMRAKQESVVKEREKQLAKKNAEARVIEQQKEQDEIEAKKKKIEEELKIGSINNKFAAHYDAVEQTLKSNTIGTLDSFALFHVI